ncbi:MAG: hypothetical protein WCV68_01700 [Candidatus Paceibacterota bacterium]|jgi:hypothetical protein
MPENKYTALESFLTFGGAEEFMFWVGRVDPQKLNFFFLLGLLGGGSCVISSRAFQLLELIDPKDYDYEDLFYFRSKGDPRAFGYLDRLIAKVPQEKRVVKGLESFQHSED